MNEPLAGADSLQEPNTAPDDAHEHADDEAGAHQVCDGPGRLVRISNARSSM